MELFEILITDSNRMEGPQDLLAGVPPLDESEVSVFKQLMHMSSVRRFFG